MSYFSNFPLRWYEFNRSNKEEKMLITNILHNVSVHYNDTKVTDEYIIKDTDSIYSISTAQYGHPDYWWIIALTNNLYMGEFQWPLTQNEFETWIDDKYITIQPREHIKHYEKPDSSVTSIQSLKFFYKLGTDWTDLEVIQKFNLNAISIYEWERRNNEKLKYIRLPKKEYIQKIERIVKDMLIQVGKDYI